MFWVCYLFCPFPAQFLKGEVFAAGSDTPVSLCTDPHSFFSRCSITGNLLWISANELTLRAMQPPAPKVPGTAPEGLFPPLIPHTPAERLRQEHPAGQLHPSAELTHRRNDNTLTLPAAKYFGFPQRKRKQNGGLCERRH